MHANFTGLSVYDHAFGDDISLSDAGDADSEHLSWTKEHTLHQPAQPSWHWGCHASALAGADQTGERSLVAAVAVLELAEALMDAVTCLAS